jgi:hypothetical protein
MSPRRAKKKKAAPVTIHRLPGADQPRRPDKALVLIGLAGGLVVALILAMAWAGMRLIEEPAATYPPAEEAASAPAPTASPPPSR